MFTDQSQISLFSELLRVGRLVAEAALVKADVDLRLHALIKVNIQMPSQRSAAITAYVSRKAKEGVGVEWCEFAPSVVKDLLHSPSIRLPC